MTDETTKGCRGARRTPRLCSARPACPQGRARRGRDGSGRRGAPTLRDKGYLAARNEGTNSTISLATCGNRRHLELVPFQDHGNMNIRSYNFPMINTLQELSSPFRVFISSKRCETEHRLRTLRDAHSVDQRLRRHPERCAFSLRRGNKRPSCGVSSSFFDTRSAHE